MCRETQHICACGTVISNGSKTKDCRGTQKQQTYLSSIELVDLDASLEPWDEHKPVEGHIVEIHRTYEQRCVCGASKTRSEPQVSGANEVVTGQSQDLPSGNESDDEEFSDECSFRESSPESDAPHPPITPPPYASHVQPIPPSPDCIDIGPPVHGVTRPFYCIVLYASCGCPAARLMHAKQFPFSCGQVRADAPVETTEFQSYILRGPRCLNCAKGSDMKDQHEISVEGMVLGLEGVKLENGARINELVAGLDRMEMT